MKNGLIYSCLQFIMPAILGLLAIGCSGKAPKDRDLSDLPELASVKGKISVNGQPAAGVLVTFFSSPDESGASSRGATNDQGEYTLTYDLKAPGATPGKHAVRLEVADADGNIDLIPPKYRSAMTSGLKADVTPGGENEISFDIKK